jgi:hypothetical protein
VKLKQIAGIFAVQCASAVPLSVEDRMYKQIFEIGTFFFAVKIV